METSDEEEYGAKLAQVRAASRSELKSEEEWSALNFATNFDVTLGSVKGNVPRIDALVTSHEEFMEKYERLYMPVVIVNAQTEWKAHGEWSEKNLLEKYGNERLKVGEDDEGYSVRMKFSHYLRYKRSTRDDSPLYIFDSTFGDKCGASGLLEDYEIPSYFKDDLFDYAEQKRRPPYRWFVMGPARSGTGIHIDPLGTSAWNALVHGYKRWCLIPTKCPKDLLKVSKHLAPRQTNEAVSWFKFAYPRTQSAEWPVEYRALEILQGPGETVFIPGGWWHVVVNLTDTVAVTQNFASVTNFPIVWHKTVRGRPKLSKKWYEKLRKVRPEVADIADRVNLNESTGMQSDESSSCSSSSSSSSDSESDSRKEKKTKSANLSNLESVPEPCGKKREYDSPDSGQDSMDSHVSKKKKGC